MAEVDQRPPRLSDDDVGAQLHRLDELLAGLEETPGPAGELAMDAVSALARIYGEALARALSCVTGTPHLEDAFLRDELLRHLLVLHDIHPEPVQVRVGRVVAEMAGSAREHGGEIALAGVHDGVATVRLSVSGCGSSAAGIADAVKEAVLAVAPELSDVAVVSARRRDTAFIPLDLLTRPPSASGAHP